ncbi:MAG: right-handed parallel beta-helix repeat-containing protein [Bacteroidota bacterium]
MRIGPHKTRRSGTAERAFLLISLVLIGAFLIWALFPRGSFPTLSDTSQAIYCGAEHVQNNTFAADGHLFEGIQYQSRQQARSGRYSILLPANGQNHFGFTSVLENPLPGEVYEISVWSFGNVVGDGKLAVQGRDPGGFYQETVEAAEVDEQGWTLHQMRVVVPFQNPPSQLAVYVYTTGQDDVFFDDIRIEKQEYSDQATFAPTRLELTIDTRNWQQLEDKRAEALQAGLLQTGENDWVVGRLQDGDWQREVKLRLKGDWLDHLRGDKWSFRVKLKKEDSWRGLQTFSLHTPAARYYLHEWLLHQYWSELGVLTTDYDFVEVVINGESKGIYAYEEHFEKQLVESRERREGPIVKFAEEAFWAGIQRQLQNHGFVRPSSGLSAENPANAPIRVFNETQLLADTVKAQLAQAAQQRLFAYQEGEASASEIFDLALLTRFYAACDLLNAYHGIIWHNQRFYYNPITTKLEPIGFDGYAETPARRYHFLAEGTLHRDATESTSLPAYFLQDSAFMSNYISILDELSAPTRWEAFIESQLPAIEARKEYLRTEFPDYQFDLETLTSEVAFVRAHLLPFSENCIRVYRTSEDSVALENTHTLPLLVKGYGPYPSQPTATLEEPIWLPAGPIRNLYSKLQQRESPLAFRSIDYWNDQALAFQNVARRHVVNLPDRSRFLFVQPVGVDTLMAVPYQVLISTEQVQVGNDAFRTASQPADFPSLLWDAANRTITVPAGEHEITKDLIIAEDHTLVIKSGAKVNLTQSAAIISYGAVQAFGSAENWIELYSSDGTGQGLQVLQATRGSILNSVIFRNLRNLRKADWQLTGAVTFYESAVQIENCRFLDNQSEDALNIVRSEFKMQRSLVQNTSSDGLDADFCKGTISNCQFINTTNDGVDFSGSVITLSNVRMEGCGDKGLSAGEASDITLIAALATKCNIGLASKDQSTLHARRLQLSNCQQGLVVFQKKPEFGPAYLLVEGLEAENNERLYQIAPGSRLQIDDELIFE